jgi:hypothetical protein
MRSPCRNAEFTAIDPGNTVDTISVRAQAIHFRLA